jgi:hypothetical protein
MSPHTAAFLPLPLLAGGGWEGVAHLGGKIKSGPYPNPPLLAGEGAQALGGDVA